MQLPIFYCIALCATSAASSSLLQAIFHSGTVSATFRFTAIIGIGAAALFSVFPKEKASCRRSLIKHGNKGFIDDIHKAKITHFYIWNHR